MNIFIKPCLFLFFILATNSVLSKEKKPICQYNIKIAQSKNGQQYFYFTKESKSDAYNKNKQLYDIKSLSILTTNSKNNLLEELKNLGINVAKKTNYNFIVKNPSEKVINDLFNFECKDNGNLIERTKFSYAKGDPEIIKDPSNEDDQLPEKSKIPSGSSSNTSVNPKLPGGSSSNTSMNYQLPEKSKAQEKQESYLNY